MIHVAICDDEQNFVAHLTKLLQRYMEETGTQLRITCFYDGLELLEHYDPSFDLIFLDIQMKLVDGLRTAEKIREMDQWGFCFSQLWYNMVWKGINMGQ